MFLKVQYKVYISIHSLTSQAVSIQKAFQVKKKKLTELFAEWLSFVLVKYKTLKCFLITLFSF
jgi:hypothetical protein